MEMNNGKKMGSNPKNPVEVWGHSVPSLFWIGVGASMLLLALKRSRNLPKNKTFCECHVPERNPIVLRRLGKVVLFAAAIGLTYETSGGIIFKRGLFSTMSHQLLYFSFGTCGLTALLEAQGRLSPDSCRACLVVVLVLEAFVMHEHSEMKDYFVDSKIHLFKSYVDITNAAVLAYSVVYPDSLIAYMGAWGLLILQGTWMTTVGFYTCCIDISMHHAAALLGFQVIFLVLISILSIAFLGPNADPDNRLEIGRDEYSLIGNNGTHQFNPLDVIKADNEEQDSDTASDEADDETAPMRMTIW